MGGGGGGGGGGVCVGGGGGGGRLGPRRGREDWRGTTSNTTTKKPKPWETNKIKNKIYNNSAVVGGGGWEGGGGVGQSCPSHPPWEVIIRSEKTSLEKESVSTYLFRKEEGLWLMGRDTSGACLGKRGEGSTPASPENIGEERKETSLRRSLCRDHAVSVDNLLSEGSMTRGGGRSEEMRKGDELN